MGTDPKLLLLQSCFPPKRNLVGLHKLTRSLLGALQGKGAVALDIRSLVITWEGKHMQDLLFCPKQMLSWS